MLLILFCTFIKSIIFKSTDDIVRTLLEGRFWSQVNKMTEWKRDFTEKGIQSAVHYILERKPEEYVVKCADGCQGILKCGNPTLTQVKVSHCPFVYFLKLTLQGNVEKYEMQGIRQLLGTGTHTLRKGNFASF